jgi:hypothetical protein
MLRPLCDKMKVLKSNAIGVGRFKIEIFIAAEGKVKKAFTV